MQPYLHDKSACHRRPFQAGAHWLAYWLALLNAWYTVFFCAPRRINQGDFLALSLYLTGRSELDAALAERYALALSEHDPDFALHLQLIMDMMAEQPACPAPQFLARIHTESPMLSAVAHHIIGAWYLGQVLPSRSSQQVAGSPRPEASCHVPLKHRYLPMIWGRSRMGKLQCAYRR